jgi:hypothetical protein
LGTLLLGSGGARGNPLHVEPFNVKTLSARRGGVKRPGDVGARRRRYPLAVRRG